MISSSYPASLGNVVRSKERGLNISAYARAIRAGVAAKLGVEVYSERDQERGCSLFRWTRSTFRRFDDMQRRPRGSLSWYGTVDRRSALGVIVDPSSKGH